MAESPRKASAWAWLALGAGLSLLPLWAHPVALVGSWLAQPALALGLGGVRGLRIAGLDAAAGDRHVLQAVGKC